MRFRAVTDVEIPEGLALRLDTLRMSHNGDTPGIAMCVAEAYAGFIVDLEEGPEGLRFGVGPPEAGHNARS
jgi:hypothetical protein